MRTIIPGLLTWLFVAGSALAQTPDPSLATGRLFSPFVLALKPSTHMSPMPGWMSLPARVQPELATVEIPIPALWTVPAVGFYVMTVVFDDRGDGGPSVEWRASDGTATVVSAGLGETGNSLGLNARTLLLPQALTREGGVALISYYGKFEGLVSVTIRPAREDLLAVLGTRSDPALVDEALKVFDRGEVDGSRREPLTGDVRNGSVVAAELSAGIKQLDGELEFIVPIDGKVEGAMLHLDALGLDPEASIGVRVNSTTAGSLGFQSFRLDDPALVPDAGGHLALAGWRNGSLFIPARLLVPGDNSLAFTLKRSGSDSASAVFLKNAAFHVRFAAAASGNPVKPSVPSEPDMALPNPLVPDATTSLLPEIVTGQQR